MLQEAALHTVQKNGSYIYFSTLYADSRLEIYVPNLGPLDVRDQFLIYQCRMEELTKIGKSSTQTLVSLLKGDVIIFPDSLVRDNV